MEYKRVYGGRIVFTLIIICIVLVSGLVGAVANFTVIINNNESQIQALTDQMNQLTDQMRNMTVANWPTQQPEPSWKLEFYKNFSMSWLQSGYSIRQPDWKLCCDGYSRIIVYMHLLEVSPAIKQKSTTIYLHYIQWYDSSSNFIGGTTVQPAMLNVTIPGPYDPQSGPAEFETKGPYFIFQFEVVSTYQSSAWAVFDMSVYFRNE